eukprot:3940661-Rhodomonas_salina.2
MFVSQAGLAVLSAVYGRGFVGFAVDDTQECYEPYQARTAHRGTSTAYAVLPPYQIRRAVLTRVYRGP